jgi:CDP-glycerol glycerophosphotransferase (TagB/SpsB family)
LQLGQYGGCLFAFARRKQIQTGRATIIVESTGMRRILLYIEQDYSFEILRPLQAAARARGDDVRWMLLEKATPALLRQDEQRISNVAEARAFDPDMVFVPGDRVPAFIPGLKVQVFHGLNEDKRGNIYRERGLFDLYCTEGPGRTAMLAPLAESLGYFRVRETGWLKLDALLDVPHNSSRYDRPQIVYASTYTPRLSSARLLHAEIERLSKDSSWNWLITLHPKMSDDVVASFRAIENDNLTFFAPGHTVELMHRADIMISDNSSILQEFLLLKKPVITCRNRAPRDCMIDISGPEQLESAIQKALNPDDQLRAAIASYGPEITSFLDGQSANRVLEASDNMLADRWNDRKPMNLWRNLKMRRQHQYYWL